MFNKRVHFLKNSIYLFESQNYRGGEAQSQRDLLLGHSLMAGAGPGWSHNAGTPSGLPFDCQGPSTWAILYCFPCTLEGSLIGSKATGTWTGIAIERRFPRLGLNLLCHITGPDVVSFQVILVESPCVLFSSKLPVCDVREASCPHHWMWMTARSSFPRFLWAFCRASGVRQIDCQLLISVGLFLHSHSQWISTFQKGVLLHPSLEMWLAASHSCSWPAWWPFCRNILRTPIPSLSVKSECHPVLLQVVWKWKGGKHHREGILCQGCERTVWHLPQARAVLLP